MSILTTVCSGGQALYYGFLFGAMVTTNNQYNCTVSVSVYVKME